jgi:transcriptional regulator with XRE-family HTH domain
MSGSAPQSAQLITTLKRALKARGLSYAQVAKALGMSESSIKRVFAEQTFTLARLEAICDLLGMTVSELARLSDEMDDTAQELSAAQERVLADDPVLLLYFYLLLNGWTPDQVRKHFHLSGRRSALYLNELERHGLISIAPSGRLRVLVSQHIAWRAGGPMRQRYDEYVKREFFVDADFGGADEIFHYVSGELSEASRAIISRKLNVIAREMEDLAKLDRTLSPSARRHMGLVIGYREWVFEVVEHLRKEPGRRLRVRPAASVRKPAAGK